MIVTHNYISGNKNIKFRNRNIDRIDSIKFLGIMLGDHLSVKTHIVYISNKIPRSIDIINRVAYHIPFPQMLSLYYALVYPHLTYGVTLWGKASVVGSQECAGYKQEPSKLLLIMN